MNAQTKRENMHRRAHKVATQYYLRRGHVPEELLEIIRATASAEAFLKYNHNHDPANGRFTSGADGGGNYPTSQVTSLADAQQIVADARGRYLGKDSQCASLTHALAPDLPAASAWKPGDKVQGSTNIPIG